MDVQTYQGGCHCGRVRFEITTDLSRATECNCSICSKKGYLHHMIGRSGFVWSLGTMHSRPISSDACRAPSVLPALRSGVVLPAESGPHQVHDQCSLS